jgi:hypothetical protein
MLLLALAPITHAAAPLAPWVARVDSFQSGKLAPHPRLLLSPPEILRVRAAAKSPEGKPYADAVRKHVDAQRAKPVPAEPDGFQDGTWNIEDWRRIVAAGGVAQNNILAAAFLYVLSQDPADLAEAKRWTLGVARWNPNGPTGIEGVDHPAHDVLHALSLSYDWLYDRWTPDERSALRACIAARGRALYKHLNPYTQDSWNNHPWFQTTAMVEAGLALAGDDVPPETAAEADAWWRYGSRLYLNNFLPLGGRDGDWHEGIHYISYTLIFVYQWADALRSATGINAYETPWLRTVGYFRLYTQPPSGGGIKFNDNNFKNPDLWDKMTAYNAARQAGDPVLQWYAEQMRLPAPTNPVPSLYSLIYRDPALQAVPPGPELPLGVWYRDSGWVVLRTDLTRSDDVQFGLKAGPHLAEEGSKGHDHPDQNGFLLNFRNEELAVDSGYYDYYDSPHHKNWTFTPRAHNTLLVDGKGQEIAPAKGSYVTAFVSARDGLDIVESEAAPAYPNGLLRSWRRQVVFARPDIFLIRDIVKPEKPVTLDWLLHGPNKFEVSGQDLFVRNQSAGLAATIIAPPGLDISQWGGFPADATPERKKPGDFPDQWHLSAKTPERVGDTVFVSALRPGHASETSPPVVRRSTSGGVEFITLPDRERGDTRLAFLDKPGRHRVWDMDTDARIVAKRGDHLAFTGASTLRDGDTPVWNSTVPADVSGLNSGGEWKSVRVRLPAAGRVRLRVPGPRSSARVNGVVTPVAYDPASGTIALTLPDGTHQIAL